MSIILLLDESGSMNELKTEAIQSVENFIEKRKKIDPSQLLTMYTFGSTIRVIYDKVPLSDIKSYENYKPYGLTKLFDCMNLALQSEEKKATCVVVTDGNDTTSDTTYEMIQKLVSSKKLQGWKFFYLSSAPKKKNLDLYDISHTAINFSGKIGSLSSAMDCLTEKIDEN